MNQKPSTCSSIGNKKKKNEKGRKENNLRNDHSDFIV